MTCLRYLFLTLLLLIGSPVRSGSNPDIILLAATFNDRPLNAQIGTGGASVGEPVSIDADLQAFVLPAGLFASPFLRLTPMATGSARYARFEFLDNVEVSAGEVRLGFVLRPAQVDRFSVLVRESDGAARSFLSMTLTSGGSIAISDAADPGGALIGSYAAGNLLVFEFRFRMDSARYDIYLNGVRVAADRSHGITDRGVGALLLGSDSGSSVGTSWFIDDVYAYRPDELYQSGFE
jgi:hypothetical protein